MKKWLLCFLSVTLCLLSLSACGQSEPAPASTPASSAAAPSDSSSSPLSIEEMEKQLGFPKKDITIVVPWSPGGTNDLMARVLQPVFKEKFNVNLVIQNSPGGASAVGISQVLGSKNDGYTLGLGSSSYLILVAEGRMKADVSAVSNICLVAAEPIVIATKAGGPYATAQDLIDAAKANPGKISIGIPGANTVNQVYAILLGKAAGVTFNFLPFDGGSDVIAEVLGSHLDAGALKPSEVIAQYKAKKLSVLGICNKEQLAVLPDVPTFASMGYDVFTLGNITQASFIMAPPGLDPQVQELLAAMFQEAIQSDEFKSFASQSGMVPTPVIGSELDSYVADVYSGLQKASEAVFTN